MANFDDYFALHEKKAYREAYAVLRKIMESHPRWSKAGDLYVWCADLELTVNDDIHKAGELLDKAYDLGCLHMESYYRVRGYVLWRSGDHDRGIQYLEKSVKLKPNISNLKSLGKVLSHDNDEDALRIWQRILEQDPNHCLAHVYLGIEPQSDKVPSPDGSVCNRVAHLGEAVLFPPFPIQPDSLRANAG